MKANQRVRQSKHSKQNVIKWAQWSNDAIPSLKLLRQLLPSPEFMERAKQSAGQPSLRDSVGAKLDSEIDWDGPKLVLFPIIALCNLARKSQVA